MVGSAGRWPGNVLRRPAAVSAGCVSRERWGWGWNCGGLYWGHSKAGRGLGKPVLALRLGEWGFDSSGLGFGQFEVQSRLCGSGWFWYTLARVVRCTEVQGFHWISSLCTGVVRGESAGYRALCIIVPGLS